MITHSKAGEFRQVSLGKIGLTLALGQRLNILPVSNLIYRIMVNVLCDEPTKIRCSSQSCTQIGATSEGQEKVKKNVSEKLQ